MTGVVGAAAQAVLGFGGAFEVMGEGRDIEGDLCGVGAGCDTSQANFLPLRGPAPAGFGRAGRLQFCKTSVYFCVSYP